MPWKETCVVDERMALVEAAMRGEVSVAGLCRLAGVSRKTAYKWLARFRSGGMANLHDQSRARLTQEHALDEALRAAIIYTRQTHPTWGIKKILPFLARTQPTLATCALSSGQRVLGSAGLIGVQSRTRNLAPTSRTSRVQSRASNDIWTVDYKGDFRMGDGRRCYPCTIVDDFSRYVLAVSAHASVSLEATQSLFGRVFRERGLPRMIRSDNGIPFAGQGVGRLTKLSVWWLSLDIELDRINPGRPGENGRHERMHRTLKAEATRPPGRDLRDQQSKFDCFVPEYNQERPHEGLLQAVPASRYEASSRAWREDAREEDVYPTWWERRTIRSNGEMKWRGEWLFLSEPLAGKVVGLQEVAEGVWELRYRTMPLALLDERGPTPTLRPPIQPPRPTKPAHSPPPPAT
jgi:putative transposase